MQITRQTSRPEPLVHRSRLCFQQRSHYLDRPLPGTKNQAAWQVHGEVLRMRPNQDTEVPLRQPVYDPANARLRLTWGGFRDSAWVWEWAATSRTTRA